MACGESDEDKAKSQVCDARADVKTQVDDLNSLTITTASISQIQDGLKAIRDDLKKITDAAGGPGPGSEDSGRERQQDLHLAGQKTAQDVVGGLGSGDAKAQLQSAVDGLAAAYKSALAPIDCS